MIYFQQNDSDIYLEFLAWLFAAFFRFLLSKASLTVNLYWPEAGRINVLRLLTTLNHTLTLESVIPVKSLLFSYIYFFFFFFSLSFTLFTHQHIFFSPHFPSGNPVTDLITQSLIEIIIALWFNHSLPLGLLVLIWPVLPTFGFLIDRLCKIMRHGMSHCVLIT